MDLMVFKLYLSIAVNKNKKRSVAIFLTNSTMSTCKYLYIHTNNCHRLKCHEFKDQVWYGSPLYQQIALKSFQSVFADWIREWNIEWIIQATCNQVLIYMVKSSTLHITPSQEDGPASRRRFVSLIINLIAGLTTITMHFPIKASPKWTIQTALKAKPGFIQIVR